jgi:hypothetical protein
MQVTLIRLNTTTNETVEVQVDIEDRVVLGRHLDSPLLLQGEALSRQHFALFITDEQLMIENLSGPGCTESLLPAIRRLSGGARLSDSHRTARSFAERSDGGNKGYSLAKLRQSGSQLLRSA